MKRSNVLKAGQFFTILDFVQQDEADIEDLFDVDLYVEMLNECYALPDQQRLTVSSLQAASPSPRLVKKAEAAFAVMPPAIEEFDHFAPAAWLIRNPHILDDDTDSVSRTLDRAQQVFETFNNIL